MATPPGRDSEWRDGWTLVLAAALGMSLVTMYSNSTGVVMKPLQHAFGWSRGQISSMTAIKSTIILLASPVVGYVVDRVGSRRVAVPGVIAYCSTLALVGFTGPNIWTWYIAWAITAFAGLMVGSTVWTSAIVSRFEKHRGLALSATLAGLGLTSAFMPPLAAWSLGQFGWRAVYFTMAVFGILIAGPTTFLFFREAKRTPDGGGEARPVRPPAPGYTFTQALKQPRYWRMALSFFAGSLAGGAFQLHLFSMMTDAKISAMHAAGYLALLGPLVIVSRLAGGWLMDRLFAPYVAAALHALPILACFLIPYMGASPLAALAAVCLIGLFGGGEASATPVLASRYFGLKAYGRNYAVLTAIVGVGYGYGGFAGGLLYDRFGSYDMLLKILAACLFVSALLLLTLGKMPSFAAEPPDVPVSAEPAA